MHYIIIKSPLFNRWRVYKMGHLEGDRTWLATFRDAQDAAAWVGTPHDIPNGEGCCLKLQPN